MKATGDSHNTFRTLSNGKYQKMLSWAEKSHETFRLEELLREDAMLIVWYFLISLSKKCSQLSSSTLFVYRTHCFSSHLPFFPRFASKDETVYWAYKSAQRYRPLSTQPTVGAHPSKTPHAICGLARAPRWADRNQHKRVGCQLHSSLESRCSTCRR